MKIAIVGSGKMGGGLGKLWAKAGHEVIFSHSRDPGKLQQLAAEAGNQSKAGDPKEAVAQSQVIMLAVAAAALEQVIANVGSLDGKIVITCVSGLQPDFTGQVIGLATDLKVSVAERVQQLAPGAAVVEAFNITFAEIIASESRWFEGDRPSVFYCGNDSDAKKIVSQLIEECGYEAIDAGLLIVARSLETLATSYAQKWCMEEKREKAYPAGITKTPRLEIHHDPR